MVAVGALVFVHLDGVFCCISVVAMMVVLAVVMMFAHGDGGGGGGGVCVPRWRGLFVLTAMFVFHDGVCSW